MIAEGTNERIKKKWMGFFSPRKATTHMQIHAHIHMYGKHVDRTSIHISEFLICIKKEQQHKLNGTFKK